MGAHLQMFSEPPEHGHYIAKPLFLH
jgi:hypothetical protein